MQDSPTGQSNMGLELSILIVEDSPDDAEIMIFYLQNEGFRLNWRRVERETEYRDGLASRPDIILSDWSLPSFSGKKALKILKETGLDIPFIIVSGAIGEESAIECLHEGAFDYILKDRPGRIGKAVRRAIDDRQQRTIARKTAESLHLQSSALDAAPAAIVVTDPDGIIEWVNPAFMNLTGFGIPECLGKKLSELESRPENAPDAIRDRQLNPALLPPWKDHCTVRKAGGHVYNEARTITPVTDQQGNLLHLVVVKEDETERLQRERELVAVAVFNSSLRTIESRDSMLPIVINLLVSLFKAEGAMVDSADPQDNFWLTESATGAWQSLLGRRWELPEGACVETTGVGQYHVTRLPCTHEHSSRFEGKLAVVEANLAAQGMTIGRIRLGRIEAWDEWDARLLHVVSEIIATHMITIALREKTEEKLHQLTALRKIDHAISGSFDLQFTLNVLLEQTCKLLTSDAASILIWNPASGYLEHIAATGFLGQDIQKVRLRIGEGESGTAALERRTRSTLDLSKSTGQLARSSLVRENGFKSHHTTPLIVKGEIKGALQVFHKNLHTPSAGWYEFFETLAQQAAIAIDNAEMFDHLQTANAELVNAYEATIVGWSHAMDLRDKETEGHSQRVTDLTVKLGRLLGMSESEIVHIRRGALLHDIGKMGVPDQVLFKPGPLSDEEWVLMRLHPVYARDMLTAIDYLVPALVIPYSHHEKWNGTGYPQGLAGGNIPLAARIFAIVDVWDALTSDRPYRKAWEARRALDYIRSQSGIHFDPAVVEAFFSILDPETTS